MGTLSVIQNKLRNIDVNSIAEDSLDENRDLIKRAQQEQLNRGERKDGSKIGKYKNPQYAAKKAAMNPLPGFGNVDLILTGSFRNDIFIDVRTDTYVIESGDSKAGDLFEKYGDPLGLGEEARIKVIKEGLNNSFVKKVKKAFGL